MDSLSAESPGKPHYLLEFAQIYVHWVGWCYLTISSSATLFSFGLQSFTVSGSFSMSRLFASAGQSIGASVSATVPPVNIQGWFPLGLTGLNSLQWESLLQHHSSKTSLIQCSAFFMVQFSYPYMTAGETIVLTMRTFVSKVMSLLFNTLSSFCHSFSSKELESVNFMATVTMLSHFGALEKKICHCSTFNFFTLLFRPHQRLFSSSSLSAIRVVSSAYLRLLIFLLAILILVCDSSSLVFDMICSAWK